MPCAAFIGISRGRHRLKFIDVGFNYNADDFESFATGIISISTLAATAATDFEQYATSQKISFTRNYVHGAFIAFEDLSSGVTYSLPSFSVTGDYAQLSDGATFSSDVFSSESFESLAPETITELPQPSTSINGPTQPTGAHFKIYL
jgi:hypothetical protein